MRIYKKLRVNNSQSLLNPLKIVLWWILIIIAKLIIFRLERGEWGYSYYNDADLIGIGVLISIVIFEYYLKDETSESRFESTGIICLFFLNIVLMVFNVTISIITEVGFSVIFKISNFEPEFLLIKSTIIIFWFLLIPLSSVKSVLWWFFLVEMVVCIIGYYYLIMQKYISTINDITGNYVLILVLTILLSGCISYVVLHKRAKTLFYSDANEGQIRRNSR